MIPASRSRRKYSKQPLHIHYLMTHGIGDVVMTVPVLKKIAHDRPVKFSITVYTETEATVIQALCPELKIDFIYFYPLISGNNGFSAFLKLIRKIRMFSPDIILTQFQITSHKSSIISFLSGNVMEI